MADVSAIRPSSVTIIAWLLIATGGMAVISIPQSIRQQRDPEVRKMMENMPFMREEFKKATSVGTGPTIVAGLLGGLNAAIGYFLLKGQNWARYGYFALTAISIGTSLAFGIPWIFILPSLIWIAVSGPPGEPPPPPPPPSPDRRMASRVKPLRPATG